MIVECLLPSPVVVVLPILYQRVMFFLGAIQGTREVEQVWENCVIIFLHFPLNLVMYFSSLCLQLCWNGTSPRFGSAKMVGTVGSTPSPYCEFMRRFPAIGALNCTLSPCFIVWNKGKNHLEAAADSSYTKVVRSTDHWHPNSARCKDGKMEMILYHKSFSSSIRTFHIGISSCFKHLCTLNHVGKFRTHDFHEGFKSCQAIAVRVQLAWLRVSQLGGVDVLQSNMWTQRYRNPPQQSMVWIFGWRMLHCSTLLLLWTISGAKRSELRAATRNSPLFAPFCRVIESSFIKESRDRFCSYLL